MLPWEGRAAGRVSGLFFRRRLRDGLLDRLQRVLAHDTFVLAVERQHGLSPCRFLRSRQHVDFGGLRRLDLGQRVLVFLLRDVPHVLGRLRHGLDQALADIRGQTVPEFLVDDHRVHHHTVVRQRHVLLHFVHLLRVLVGRRIFFAVHYTLL